MGEYTWMCPTELDRERLVATVSGVGRARAVMFVVLAGVVAASSRETGWWPMPVLIGSAVVSILLYRDLDRRRRPEYWAAAGWLATQVPLGFGIAITGGARSPALSWLAIAVVSLVARFNRVTIRVGMVFLGLLLLADTVGVDAAWTLRHPAGTLITGGLLFSVWIFAEAMLRSDLQHRDHDKVTGLPNQTKFADHLHLALRRRERRGGTISVLAVDLDGFGLANDSLGPRVGDRLLRHAGARISRAAGSADIVARRSADEFLILLADLGDSPAARAPQPWVSIERAPQDVAHSVQAALAEAISVDDREIYLGACIGIAVLAEAEQVDDQEKTVEQLLSGAQLALSSARSAGPGSVTVFDSAQPSSGRRLSLIARLRKAIDNGELSLHYQPTVDLHTGELKGVEALARWEDDELGVVSPGEFIGVAEETGLIEPLGAWVMDEVARQAREWDQEGLEFEIAFNLSPRQLWQPKNLLPRMRASLAAAEVPLDRFVVEITESSALQDFESTVALLREMTAEGFRLAIDDFGVELSSLSRLLEIPAQVLKVDRSFISALSASPDAAVMVQMIIQLADKLGMRAHAEGVEDEAQRRFLLENGCQYGQGYLFSKPAPASEIRELYLRSRAARLIPVAPDMPTLDVGALTDPTSRPV